MPVAATLRLMAAPAQIVDPTGCVVMTGGLFTVRVAAPELVPVQLASARVVTV